MQLPATIIGQLPLVHVKLSPCWTCLEPLMKTTHSTLATTPLVHAHNEQVFLGVFSLPGTWLPDTPRTPYTTSGRGTSWYLIFLFFLLIFSAAFPARDTDNGSPRRRALMYPPNPLTRRRELGPWMKALGPGQPNARKKQRRAHTQKTTAPGSLQYRQRGGITF